MKKIIFALMALAMLVSCNKEDHGDANLHITGNIKGLKKGTLYIQKISDTTLVAIDTIVFNGKSTFETYLKIDSPEMLYLFLDRGQSNSIDNNLPFFAEPGNMKIESSNDEFFYRAKITGSENQKLYEDFLKIKSRFVSDNLDLVAKNLEATKNSNVKQLDSISLRSEQLIKRRYLYTANFALNHAKNEVGPYLALSEIADINIKYLDTIQKSMSPKIAKSLYGKMLTKYVAERKKTEAAEVK
ncbi:DUF4369 domain-containing protein [Flavobacterium hauense]